VIRDLSQLAEREFDVLVVGGGIYGLTTAYDAAQRGLSVALIERGDFGGATSFNHLKTIHGGLRYLQSADLRRMRESMAERRAFARIAPRFVEPCAFAMPAGGSLTRSPLAMRAAFAIDAFIGRDRNEGVHETRRLPAGRIITGPECRRLFEGALHGVSASAVWHDYRTVNGERLTLSFAKAAARCGAVLANYTEAADRMHVRGREGRGAAVRAIDKLTGHAFDIRARMLVSATGPWGATRRPLLKAMNLVTSRPARDAALVAATRGGRRSLVLMPWQGRTLVGTSQSPDERRPDDQEARRAEVEAFLADVNEAFPELGLKFADLTLVHRGIVPAIRKNGRLMLLPHSQVIDHAQSGSPGPLSIVGVKYTTARAVAERAVDLIVRRLGRAPAPCRTAELLLPDAALDDRDPPDSIVHAVREEMALTLTDVVVRRIGLGVVGYPGDAAANDVACRVQAELGWSEERKQSELQALKDFYAIH
jgi:glycerol-3-phosphate dehydrogenase